MSEILENKDNVAENIEIKVCKKINHDLCGNVVNISANKAEVKFTPTETMIADDNMIIHNGFIFSAASLCAISAVNEPNSMIIYSEIKFLSPIELHNDVIFKSHAIQSNTKKREVTVEGYLYNIKIFDGIFHIIVFDKNMFKIDFTGI